MNTTAYKKECPECKQLFIATRLNQTYCTTICKSRHNNRKSQLKNKAFQEKLELRRKIDKVTHAKNSILWINRQILKKYVDQQMNISTLEEAGFKLRHITDFDEFENEQSKKASRFFVYDFGYYFIDEHTIKIIEP